MSTADRSLTVRNWVIGIVVVLLAGAAGWFAMFGTKKDETSRSGDGTPASSRPTTSANGNRDPGEMDRADPTDASGEPQGNPRVAEWVSTLGSPPRWPSNWSAAPDCDAVEQKFERVCAVLDEGRAPAGPSSCDGIRQAASVLAGRPPRVGSELRSYEAILSNVFHMFRVLGRDRIAAVRGALADRPELAEPVALAAYRWAIGREECERGSAVTSDVLYEYAAFLFQTMGGQAYLRRRAPRVEALACFYGLDILERSIGRDHNPHGVDPRAEIARCRDLISSQDLVFKEDYVKRLDEMDRRWDRKGS